MVFDDLRGASVADLVESLQRASQEDSGPYCEEIIRRFEPLLRKAWRHVPQPFEYQDFVQEVFVRLFGGLPRLRDYRAFPGYFQRCVQSTVATALRRKRPADVNIEDMTAETANRLDQEILTAVFLQSYLDLLPPSERRVLQLEWIDGLSPAETAGRLGLSRGGASAAKSRGISKLRQIIAREARWLETAARSMKQT